MKFVLSGNLLRFSDFQREIVVEGSTVQQGIAALAERCPALRPVMLDGQSQLRRVYRIFLNGKSIAIEELERATSQDDEVVVLTAIAGG
jgi:molybdopterin synthase sulfur carrier subunit